MSSHLAHSIGSLWHQLLLLLHVRNEYDWAFPAWPEVNHPYMPHATLRCCEHCGGGRLNWIHREPYDPRRVAEIFSLNQASAFATMEQLNRRVELESGQKSILTPFPTHARRHGYIDPTQE